MMKAHTGRTIRLSEDAPGWVRENPVLMLGVALIAAGIALSLFWPADAAPAGDVNAVEVAPTPALRVVIVQSPTTDPAVLALPRAVVAYAEPDGAPLGAIEAGRQYRPLARSGDGWLLLDVQHSGAVWVRSDDLTGAAAGLPNLATPTAQPAPQVVIVEQPAPAVVYQAQAAPAAPTAEMVHWSELPQFVSPPDYPAPEVWYTPQPLPNGWHPPMAPDYVPSATPAWHAPMVLP